MIRLNQTHVREEEFCKFLETQEKFVKARLFFYFNVEHVFIVNIEKQTQNKNFADFIKRIFKNRILLQSIFEYSVIHKPSLGSCEVPQQNMARSV